MRFNSVLGAIFFVFLACSVAIVVFVQTRAFGELLTRVITDVSEKKAQTKVGIRDITISLFPPGVELNRVSVEKALPGDKFFSAELGTVGFYLNLIEIEERKLAFGEIKISDSVLDLKLPQTEGEPLERIEDAHIDMAFDLVDQLPVRVDTLLLENSRFIANHELVDVRRLKLFKKDDSFIVRFHIGNLQPLADQPVLVDEVWADAEITKRNISIHRLRLQHDVHTLLLKGQVNNWPSLTNADFKLVGETQLFLKGLDNLIEFPEMISFDAGVAQLLFNISREQEKVKAGATVSISDLRSSVAYADNITAELSLNDSKVLLSRLDLIHKQEKLKLLMPVIVANIDKKTFLTDSLRTEVEGVTLNNALRILGPSMQVLKGDLFGRVTFSYRNGDLFFRPIDGFEIKNLALVVGENDFQVLKVQRTQIKNGQFSVVGGEFQMTSVFNLPRSELEVDGFVNPKEVRFSVENAAVDLEDLGDIASLGIKGKGRLSVEVSGPLEDTELNFKGKMNGFEVLGYKTGASDLEVGIGIANSTVNIKRFESTRGKTQLSGSGAINYDNLDIALGVNTRSTNFNDLSQILQPIFSKLAFLPADLEFNAKIDAYIFGKTSLDDLKVKAEVNFQDMVGYGEGLGNGRVSVELANQVVALNNFRAEKEKGNVVGDFAYKLDSEEFSLNYAWDGLALSNFNLTKRTGVNFDGALNGTIEGVGKADNYELHLKNILSDTRTADYQFSDSHFDIKITPQKVFGTLSLFGEYLHSNFDLALTAANRSNINVDLNVPDLKPLTVALFGQHLQAEDFSGRVDVDFNGAFSKGLSDLDLSGHVREWIFNHEQFNINYASEKPQFQISKGKVNRWKLDVRQPDLFLQTKGEGSFGQEVSLVHELHFNSKILEVLLSRVLSADGFVRSIIRVDGKNEVYDFSATSRSADLNLSLDGLPVALNNLKYSMEFVQQRLSIKELRTALDSGSVSIKGDIFFDADEPDVNLKYELDRAEIPILGKSVINASGEGIILGNHMPYNLGGEITLNKALIVNELNEFNSRSSALGQIRFLPKNQESPLSRLVNLDLNVKIDNPARITNSLMDVGLRGEVRLTGSPVRPRGDGRLFAPINSSRIFFKNNEYFITNADLNFTPKKEISNPDFDIQALTTISSYRVNAKAYGDLERFNFDLTSDPILPRQSILSLIAFGYTDEIQSTLDPKEQQNLTQVGVGSFVFDRFKITDILNKQFGLQVNLGTVFEQSETESMLEGRSQEGAGGTLARTRSATKIELKKRLDEALTLSVSSTMGGSIGQRQSMNLTYNVNKKVQLEGVYELRTNDEGQEDVIDNSLGGDLKFRWTFK